jgi:hypothetical protein
VLRLALALCLLCSSLAVAQPVDVWPRVIDAVELHGVTGTRDFVILRELPWHPGEAVSEEAWALGLTRLWNCDLFSHVDGRVELREGHWVAVLDLEERFSLNPLLSYGVGGGAWWGRAGASDNNWLGRDLEWGLRYERFDVYNGGQGWLRDPRFFNRRLLGLVQVDWLFRPRPLYVRRRLGGTAELSGEVDDVTRLGLKLEVFRDVYLAPREGEAQVPGTLLAGQLTGSIRAGRVDTVRLRQLGHSVELKQTFGVSQEVPVYWQTFVEAFWFKIIGERWNVAVRGQAALSSQAPMELGYWVGGLDLVRGYDDSRYRTLRYALINAEVRATLFDSTWFALVAAGFVDGALVDHGGLTPLLSTGAGLRFLVPKLLKTGIRADFALTLAGRVQPGISLGVYQFF